MSKQLSLVFLGIFLLPLIVLLSFNQKKKKVLILTWVLIRQSLTGWTRGRKQYCQGQ